MKDWFKARNIWGAAINALSDEEAGRLAKAIWAYTMKGEIQDLEGSVNGTFAMILLTLEQDAEKDDRISEVRAIAGQKGGMNTSYGKRQQMIANDSKCKQEQANVSNCSNKNKNKNKEEESDKECNRRFTPPTLEEVTTYCKERNNGIDPEYFMDYHIARNWILSNGKQARDWKAVVRTWEKNGINRKKANVKLMPAQDYTQRDYSGAQDEAIQRFMKMAGGGKA